MKDIISIDLYEPLENITLPNPKLMMFYKDLESRILWIDSEITDDYLDFGKYIIQWNKEDMGIDPEKRKPIKIMIFSPGGDLDINDYLIDLIKISKTPVYGINMGVAYSSACCIFMACHKRYALNNSVFLIHKGYGEMNGSYDEVIMQAEEYQRKIGKLINFIISNSGISEDEISERIYTDWYISADDAYHKYGFVDCIVEDIDILT